MLVMVKAEKKQKRMQKKDLTGARQEKRRICQNTHSIGICTSFL
jgi:hypothetical protein